MKALFTLTGRIGVIMVAAFVVVWVTMGVVDTSGTNGFPQERRDEFAQQGAVTGNIDGHTQERIAAQQGEGHPFRGERHGPQDQRLAGRLTFGLFGMLKNFVIIGIVAAIGVGLERFFTRRPVKAAL